MTQNSRAEAKAVRRRELLIAAARLMAVKGYAAVRLEDIGSEVGVSGPAMYRHFANKHDLLAELLVDVSRRLRDGGHEVTSKRRDPADAMVALVRFHVDFALTEPDLIEIQYRDFSSLNPTARRDVRRLQREYVGMWVDVLVALVGVPAAEALLRVHAVFGLINSSPRLPDLPSDTARVLLVSMATAALGVTPDPDGITHAETRSPQP